MKITRKQVLVLCGFCEKTLEKRIADGSFHVDSDGNFDLNEVGALIEAKRRNKVGRPYGTRQDKKLKMSIERCSENVF